MILKNTYFILRHGESEANVAQLITSDPAQCVTHFGLTRHGKEKVAAAVRNAQQKSWLNAETIIYSSDFRRAIETAQIAGEILGAGKIHLSIALRERFFGGYDGQKVKEYLEIWPTHQRDTRAQQIHGVENSEEIAERLIKLIEKLETQYQNECLLLVSHGDPLQVLQATFAGLDPECARLLKYIQPGEIKALILSTNQKL